MNVAGLWFILWDKQREINNNNKGEVRFPRTLRCNFHGEHSVPNVNWLMTKLSLYRQCLVFRTLCLLMLLMYLKIDSKRSISSGVGVNVCPRPPASERTWKR